MNRRAQWRDGVKASGMSRKACHAALVVGDWWRADQLVIWVELKQLQAEMSVSRRTAQYALQELVENGWLVVVEKARQHRCPRYAPTIPRGAESALLDHPRGAENAPPAGDNPVDNSSRGADSALRGAESAPDTTDTKTNTTSRPVSVTGADDLAMVVVESLPQHLASSITASVLRRRCLRLAGLGWTPDLLRPAVDGHSWVNIRAGGVIAWLSGLDHPDSTESKPKRPGCADCIDGWMPSPHGFRSEHRCQTCHPTAKRATA